MPLDSVWIQLGVSVLAGALAGGLTNHVAVWMLFHPYERRFGLQGAIPKNKARLARSLGRTVGEKLLGPTDLLTELSQSGVRAAFEERVSHLVDDLLNNELGSLREILSPGTLHEIDAVIETLAGTITAGVEGFLDSDDFQQHARNFVVRLRNELGRQPLGELISPRQRDKLAEGAREWAEEFSRSPELERAIREYLQRHAERLLNSSDPIAERIPESVLGAVEGAIESYLPLAAHRLGTFLARPASREKIRDALHGIFRRLMKDLEFHQRLIARLVVTERTFDRALDALERDGVEQLAALLEDETLRDELVRSIRDAVQAFLQKPFSEVVGPAGERSDALVQSAGDYLLRILRDERTHSFVSGKLREVIERAENRTVADVISGVSDEAVVGWISSGARSARSRELVAEGVRAVLRRSLDARIGRPARWLSGDSAGRITATVVPALWDWVQNQLPQMIAKLDLEAMVERKVLGFSTQRMEEIIRGVTERELRLIVKLGYLLGAMIGTMTFGITRLAG